MTTAHGENLGAAEVEEIVGACDAEQKVEEMEPSSAAETDENMAATAAEDSAVTPNFVVGGGRTEASSRNADFDAARATHAGSVYTSATQVGNSSASASGTSATSTPEIMPTIVIEEQRSHAYGTFPEKYLNQWANEAAETDGLLLPPPVEAVPMADCGAMQPDMSCDPQPFARGNVATMQRPWWARLWQRGGARAEAEREAQRLIDIMTHTPGADSTASSIAAHPRVEWCRSWVHKVAAGFMVISVALLSCMMLYYYTATSMSGGRSTGGVTGSNSPQGTTKHLVVTIIDDQGWNDMGYASSDLSDCSPIMDALSADGIRLSNHYTQYVCTPARGALLTGKYPIHLGLQHWQVEPSQPWGLALEHAIMPEFFQQLKYDTHLVGKWHLGHFSNASLPTRRGFHSFYGYYSGAEDMFSHISEESCDETYHKQPTCYADLWSEEDQSSNPVPVEAATDLAPGSSTYLTHMLAGRAEKIILGEDGKGPTNPLFLVASFPNVHSPLAVPDEVFEENPHLAKIPNDIRRMLAASLLTVDHAVGRLVKASQDAGLYNDTIFVVLSDNGGLVSGGGNNFPLRGEKNTVFEGGIKTHAFIHSALLPTEARGSTYAGLFHITDWLPTMIEGMLNIKPEDGAITGYSQLDGYNHWNALIAPDSKLESPRKNILINIDYLDDDGNYLGYERAAFRYGDWKLIINEKDDTWYPVPTQKVANLSSSVDWDLTAKNEMKKSNYLFNIREDPFETTDLRKTNSTIYKALAIMLKESYFPTMVRSQYQPTDPNCFLTWDRKKHFVAPWIHGGDDSKSPFIEQERLDYEALHWPDQNEDLENLGTLSGAGWHPGDADTPFFSEDEFE